MKTTVSIIVPIYNVEDYIRETLLSIINQTYKELEIILINDGSTDKSYDAIKDLIEDDKRIIYIEKENEGLGATRNVGIKKASGDYIYFIDSDDILKLNCIGRCVEVAQKYNSDIVTFNGENFIDSSFDLNNEANSMQLKNEEGYMRREYMEEGEYNSIDFFNIMQDFTTQIVAVTVLFLIKREIFTKYSLLFNADIIHEDELFSRELLFSNIPLYHIKESFYLRRLRGSSITTSNFTKHKADSLLILANNFYLLYKKYNNQYLKQDWMIYLYIYVKKAKEILPSKEILHSLNKAISFKKIHAKDQLEIYKILKASSLRINIARVKSVLSKTIGNGQ